MGVSNTPIDTVHWLRRLRAALALKRVAEATPRRPVSKGGLTIPQRWAIYTRTGRPLTPAQRRRIHKHQNRARGAESEG